MRPAPDAFALGESWKLGFAHVPPRGPAGERVGRGTGSSLEFHDRRSYEPGDDVRHLDWRAYARTDTLLVRQWREEVLARCEILVDGSRSMAIDERKAQLALDLAALLSRAAVESGAEPAIVCLEDAPRPLSTAEFGRDGLRFESRGDVAEALRGASGLCRRGAMTIVISDFLAPHEARELVTSLSTRSGALAFVQLLSEEEVAPPIGSARRMIDCESGASLDLVLDEATVRRYLERLARLSDALASEARRAGALFIALHATEPLEKLCRERLAPAGLLVPSS